MQKIAFNIHQKLRASFHEPHPKINSIAYVLTNDHLLCDRDNRYVRVGVHVYKQHFSLPKIR